MTMRPEFEEEDVVLRGRKMPTSHVCICSAEHLENQGRPSTHTRDHQPYVLLPASTIIAPLELLSMVRRQRAGGLILILDQS